MGRMGEHSLHPLLSQAECSFLPGSGPEDLMLGTGTNLAEASKVEQL